MKLKCQCCGFEHEFYDGETAFIAGWDAPPHFTGYVTCNLCPAVCVVLGLPHTKAHADWEKNGRPTEFGVRCVPDEDWGQTEEQFEQNVEAGKALIKMFMEKTDN